MGVLKMAFERVRSPSIAVTSLPTNKSITGSLRTMEVGKVSRRPCYDLSIPDSAAAIWFEYRYIFKGIELNTGSNIIA